MTMKEETTSSFHSPGNGIGLLVAGSHQFASPGLADVSPRLGRPIEQGMRKPIGDVDGRQCRKGRTWVGQ
jgi:hypothetical protein